MHMTTLVVKPLQALWSLSQVVEVFAGRCRLIRDLIVLACPHTRHKEGGKSVECYFRIFKSVFHLSFLRARA